MKSTGENPAWLHSSGIPCPGQFRYSRRPAFGLSDTGLITLYFGVT
jgi:predicted DNA-binding ribbon-helix-helix protein